MKAAFDVLARRWEYAALTFGFLSIRAGLWLAGFPFELDLRWMFLADLRWLREDLWETLLYFHAFPPGMNILTGVWLKLGDGAIDWGAPLTFVACGLVLAWSLLALGRGVGLSKPLALGLALAFTSAPPALYFENLYLYTYPSTTLLALAGACLHLALTRERTGTWLAFFGSCCVLGWFRSMFHVVWFVAMLIAALAVSRRRMAVLRGAVVPAILLVALYAKNYALFGVFGATSWGGANLTTATTETMPIEERRAWISEGRLSPYAAVSVYSAPRLYLRRFPQLKTLEGATWPHALDTMRPTLRVPNYNHALFLEVNVRRRADARAFIRAEPGKYLHSVATRGLVKTLEPTTRWHPGDDDPKASPHTGHRKVLGGYERAYNAVLHGWPLAPMGLYVLAIPCVLLWGIGHGLRAWRDVPPDQRAADIVLGFGALQVLFVVGLSALFTVSECSRYRYLAEPYIWLVMVHLAATLGRRFRATLAAIGRRR